MMDLVATAQAFKYFVICDDAMVLNHEGMLHSPSVMHIRPFWCHSISHLARSRKMFERKINLSQKEEEIFKILRECVQESKLQVILRVAGGWVRDKLLGLDCHDLDIAIDKMMGERFAVHLLDYLKLMGVNASACGVIQSNPDRSKHLETATLSIHGQCIDFVNLRAETYALDSRIPNSIEFGTPLEDALRRDITINSMFWNIHSQEIEDFTGHGLADLEDGVVRTPLAPKETLMDDPLRLLRVVRFATRFQYTIVPELLEAMKDPIVHQSLREKVSRERIGIEVDKILNDRYGLQGLFLFNQVGVFDIIFGCQEVQAIQSFHQASSFQAINKLLRVFSKFLYFDPEWSRGQLRTGLLAVGMLSYAGLKYPLSRPNCNQSTFVLKEDYLVHSIIKDCLKLSNKDAALVGSLLNQLDAIDGLLFGSAERSAVKLGRLLKEIGSEWKLAFYLATVRRFWMDGKSSDEEMTVREYLTKLSDLLLYIDGLGLTASWSFKPLLTGKDLQHGFGIKEGEVIGQALRSLLDWQYCNPHGTADEAREFVRQLISEAQEEEK